MQIKSRISERHTAGFKLDEVPDAGRDGTVVVRFDGKMMPRGRECVFAVISAEDLAKLPADVLHGMNMLENSGTGALVESTSAFFTAHPSHGTCLYVDTDTHDGFLVRARAAAEAEGLSFVPVKGDLLALEDGKGFVAPPKESAAERNNFVLVKTRDGLGEVRERRAALEHRHPGELGEIPDGPLF